MERGGKGGTPSHPSTRGRRGSLVFLLSFLCGCGPFWEGGKVGSFPVVHGHGLLRGVEKACVTSMATCHPRPWTNATWSMEGKRTRGRGKTPEGTGGNEGDLRRAMEPRDEGTRRRETRVARRRGVTTVDVKFHPSTRHACESRLHRGGSSQRMRSVAPSTPERREKTRTRIGVDADVDARASHRTCTCDPRFLRRIVVPILHTSNNQGRGTKTSGGGIRNAQKEWTCALREFLFLANVFRHPSHARETVPKIRVHKGTRFPFASLPPFIDNVVP